MLLADEFFLIAHDDTTGKPKLHSRAAGYGLAGGLLAELVLYGHISVDAAVLSVLDHRPPPDALAHTVLDQIVGEPEHRGVRIWLDFLGQSAAESVGERLARAGVVRREETRRLLRTSIVYPPVDINAAAWLVTRLRAVLDRSDSITTPDAMLLGLVTATNLTRQVWWESEPRVLQRLSQTVAALPPPLRELVMHIEAAVGAAVMSHRT